jgi:D-alanine-D-alanine ligase
MSQQGSVGRSLRVGVLFGGRSGEHEVSLASARNVMEALEKAGHTVVPMGITPQGHWLTQNEPLRQLSGESFHSETLPDHTHSLGSALAVANGQQRDGAYAHEQQTHAASAYNTWSLLPQATQQAPLPELDLIFPVLHGTYGEDGTVQGLLEMANLPYVGSGVLASAVVMDKAVAKQLFAQAGLRQSAYELVLRREWRQAAESVLDRIEARFAYPLFVKPANLGSSVGVSKVRDRAELGRGLDLACRFDRKVLVEVAVPHAREIEVSVLGNDEPSVSVVGEVVPGNEFYDYAAKYLDESSKLLIPAAIDADLVAEVQAMALTAFRLADCAGLARVDFLLDDASKTLYLNELNTMPGFTKSSMYPKLWEASGLSYPALVDRLLALALERHADKLQNRTTRDL